MYQLSITLKSGLTLIDYCDGDPNAVSQALKEGKENIPMGELIVTAGAVASWEVIPDEVTENDIRETMARLCEEGKTHICKRILNKYGVRKVSDLNPDTYNKVMEDLKNVS